MLDFSSKHRSAVGGRLVALVAAASICAAGAFTVAGAQAPAAGTTEKKPAEAAAKKTRCVAFDLQTKRSTLPDFVHDSLKKAYAERIGRLSRVEVVGGPARDQLLGQHGIIVSGEINQRAAAGMLAGTGVACHITAGVSLTDNESRAVFQIALDRGAAPALLVTEKSTLVDADMKKAIDAAVAALDERLTTP